MVVIGLIGASCDTLIDPERKIVSDNFPFLKLFDTQRKHKYGTDIRIAFQPF
eukprot:m.71401 g.71401  ORF g.71401 m.71401 type:complete len:52 (-) comp10065_c0_seq2:2625-2780(-)